jgi:hypothetical protein
VSFSAPPDNSAPITGYTVTASDTLNPANGGETQTGMSSPITVSGLTNGDTYTFTVTATNALGSGPQSTASNAVIPMTLPGAPTEVAAISVTGGVTVIWDAPSFNGGAAITGYRVSASGGGEQSCSTSGAVGCTVTGLAAGDSYTFTVTATNAVGTGASSTISNAAMPGMIVAPPPSGASGLGAPTSSSTPSNTSLTVTETQGTASVTVFVPAGALPTGTAISVYPVSSVGSLLSMVPSGDAYVTSLVVSWETPSGTSPAASLPITMTISDPAIVAGDVIYEVGQNGKLTPAGTATANGVVTLMFATDPNFLVMSRPQIISHSTRAVLKGSRLPVKLQCKVDTCSGSAKLTEVRVTRVTRDHKTVPERRTVVLASAAYRVGRNKNNTVSLQLNATGRSVLSRSNGRTLRVRLVLTVTGGLSRSSVLRVS